MNREANRKMAGARAHINPEMLVWARKRVNYDPGELAKRAGTSLDIYSQWEKAEKRPTIKQIQKIARALRRPVTHFYLQEAPDEPQPRLEMRRVFGSTPGADTTVFSLEVQECVRRREIALELFERLGETPAELPEPVSIGQDPEKVAEQVRFGLLDLGIKEQIEWSNKYEALKAWREALERVGVLSFQMSGVDLTEARGFAIADRPLPVASFNSKDSVRGRIFTLLHEFAHILLGTSTLHSRPPLESDDEIEFWCNRVAAAILIPRSDLLALPQVRQRGEEAFWREYDVEALARRYNVSAAAMLRRLNTFNLIARPTFETLREVFDSYARERDTDTSSGGGNFYLNTLTQLGSLLPSLAFRSFYAEEISVLDLSSIMGTKIKNLGNFEERVMGSLYAFRGS